jgi:hypothetical protein
MSLYALFRSFLSCSGRITGISLFFYLVLLIFSTPRDSRAQEYFWWVDSSRANLGNINDPLFSGSGHSVVGLHYDNTLHRSVLVRWEIGKGLTVLDTLLPQGFEATGVSADGQIIVGNADGNDGTHGSYGYAVRWTAGTRFETLPWSCSGNTPLGGDCSYFAWTADADGNAAGEGYIDSMGYTRPWQYFSGSAQLLQSPDTISSGVLVVSADGSAAAGYTTSTYYGSAPAAWLGGSLMNLSPNDRVTYGSTWYVSNGGSIVLGYYKDTTSDYHSFYYTPSYGFTEMTATKYFWRGSADGSRILGYDNTGLALWTDIAGAGRNFHDLCENDYGMDLGRFNLGSIWGMSHDGMSFMGEGTDVAGYSGTYIIKLTRTISVRTPKADTLLVPGTKDTVRWLCPGDLQTVNIAVSYDDGLSKTTLASGLAAQLKQFVWTVPDSQSTKCRVYITSVGDTLAGKSGLFSVGKDTFIIVTSPRQNDRWIAGDKDTIRWKSKNVQSVNISFSTNDGADMALIGWNVPADTGMFIWKVPDSLSTLCRIMIQSYTDTLKGVSERFNVKGYVMTRFTAAGQYEAFAQGTHDWQFGNEDKYMWPRTWWQQFNYRGVDPITGELYPSEEPFIGADSSSFPDWPLFVKVYGIPVCYWSLSPAVSYREKGTELWKGFKSSWDGSCAGIAVSSILAFDRKDQFLAAFPEVPDFVNVHELSCTDTTRLAINQIWSSWFGTVHQNYVKANRLFTPTQTLHDIQSMTLSAKQDGQYLYLANNGKGGGAHAIVAYGVKEDTAHPGHFFVSVYDNSYPNDYNARIEIDTTANGGKGSWTYSNWAGWGGPAKLWLMDPSSNYLVPPVLPRTTPGRNYAAIPASVSGGTGRMTAYVSNVSSVIISDSSGNRIGFDSTGTITEIPDAYPIMPPVSKEVPPFGYDLPEGKYSVSLSGFTDTSISFSMFGDSIVYSYSRSDAKPGQQDLLDFGTHASFVNKDSSAKSIHFKMIVAHENSEDVLEVAKLSLPPADSLTLGVGIRSGMAVSHTGGPVTFDLALRKASAIGTLRFAHHGFTLGGNSGMTAVPVWGDLDTGSVKILLDNGNTGTPNDSVSIDNQALGVNEQRTSILPKGYALLQNYPNPFNPVTNIVYDVPVESHVRLRVYSILGQEVATLVNSIRQPGQYTIQYSALQLPSGVYFYRFDATSVENFAKTFTQTGKMVLIR